MRPIFTRFVASTQAFNARNIAPTSVVHLQRLQSKTAVIVSMPLGRDELAISKMLQYPTGWLLRRPLDDDIGREG